MSTASSDGDDGPDMLQEALSLDQLDRDLFRSVVLYTPRGARGTFGGQLVAHALVAASWTIDDREGKRVHSLHSNFLSKGDSTQTIYYRVRRVRDGAAFSTRTVTAFQKGGTIFVANLSFHRREEPGISHQPSALPAAAKTPDDAVPERELMLSFARVAPQGSQLRENFQRKRLRQASIQMRYNGIFTSPTATATSAATANAKPPADDTVTVQRRSFVPHDEDGTRRPTPAQQSGYTWIRANVVDVSDIKLHRAIAFFVTDSALAFAPMIPHGLPNPNLSMMVSLDHSVYFHEDFAVNEWFLYETNSTWANANRGLAFGKAYTKDGKLVMSVVQEVLIRMTKGHRSIAKL